ncbi:MAG: phosphatidate cytidylyltransferase [Lachnospiraceae bacterium]|nr:phosphatidate cytidylyltransferase [Lachnospiraceae bacterium]
MFIKRLLSGIVLLAIAIFSIVFGGYYLAGVLLVLSLTAFYELSKALGIKKVGENSPIMNLGFVGIVIYYAVMAFSDDLLLLGMVAAFMVIAFLCMYVFTFPKYRVEDIMSAVFSFIYAPVMLAFVYLTRNLQDGYLIVWMIIISSWGFDTCAYCVGMLTGKTIGNHKFLPRLSPKKSIEGVVGGVVGAGIIAYVFGNFFMPDVKWFLCAMAAIGGIIAQVGDLAASAIKRNKDIKDYGRCIPGHGGVMDRFDSMIFTAPITYFLAVLWIVAVR